MKAELQCMHMYGKGHHKAIFDQNVNPVRMLVFGTEN